MNNSITTWTDEEMRNRLELLGYDLTDEDGEYSHSIMTEIASHVEGYKWNDDLGVWHE